MGWILLSVACGLLAVNGCGQEGANAAAERSSSPESQTAMSGYSPDGDTRGAVALRTETFDGGFFTIEKPAVWRITTAGACGSFAFLMRDPAVSHERLGDLHRGLGDGAKALEFYQKALTIREELHRRNPQSADRARDLWISCWRMALNAEETGRGNALAWWRKAFELLNGMKLRGIMLPTDERYLAALREKVGGSTAG